ncbi:MAG: hypothetical protein ACI7YS_17385 [Flavobacterium sp.]
MPKETEIKKAAMIKAMEDALGVVTIACKTVGINRRTHYVWMEDDPEYKKAIEDISEVALDFAESKLHQSIQNGSDTATIFYLKTKGKKRGYIERSEIDQTVRQEPIQLIFPDHASVETD